MIRFKPLPLVQTIAKLVENGEQKEAVRLQQGASRELLDCQGFQFVLKILRDVQISALSQISLGQRPEYFAGQLAAVDMTRACLAALVPVEEAQPEQEELEEAFTYDSGFNIPLPE